MRGRQMKTPLQWQLPTAGEIGGHRIGNPCNIFLSWITLYETKACAQPIRVFMGRYAAPTLQCAIFWKRRSHEITLPLSRQRQLLA